MSDPIATAVVASIAGNAVVRDESLVNLKTLGPVVAPAPLARVGGRVKPYPPGLQLEPFAATGDAGPEVDGPLYEPTRTYRLTLQAVAQNVILHGLTTGIACLFSDVGPVRVQPHHVSQRQWNLLYEGGCVVFPIAVHRIIVRLPAYLAALPTDAQVVIMVGLGIEHCVGNTRDPYCAEPIASSVGPVGATPVSLVPANCRRASVAFSNPTGAGDLWIGTLASPPSAVVGAEAGELVAPGGTFVNDRNPGAEWQGVREADPGTAVGVLEELRETPPDVTEG